MATALEIVESVYQRFAQGDLEGFLNLCAEDIEWVVNGPSSLEKCRDFHGKDGVRKFLEILGDSWEFRSFTPKEFFADGPTVVVLGEETGADKITKEPFQNRWAHVFDIMDGRVARFREFLCHWRGERRPPEMSWLPLQDWSGETP